MCASFAKFESARNKNILENNHFYTLFIINIPISPE